MKNRPHGVTRAIRVVEPMDRRGWVTLVADGHWVQAKLSSAPSRSGIGGGRVFRLYIAAGERFSDRGIYNYACGLDFGRTPPGFLEDVLAYLEAL